ncbi:hypothetical protein ACIP5Y_33150 [Nocardia sp. NPDC088792]|uniref:hypothetical protein n=1 Tax=Nocardia sp. NPDC088792 TaxID=3364332 RepID=UPI00380A2056
MDEAVDLLVPFREEVESAIFGAIGRASVRDGYPVDAKVVIEDAAQQLSANLSSVDIDLKLVIDFPFGRANLPAWMV